MALLEVNGIGKSFGATSVLRGISFDLAEGEALAIIGSSGSGKTTLLRCLNFLETADTGSITVAGETLWSAADTRTQSEEAIRKKRLHFGLVFQNFNLLPRQSVLENVALPLLYAGVRKKERLERAKEMLARVGLEERIQFKPTQLSGGQKQRVAIARAMVSQPRLLLADEPTGALDTRSGEQVMELFAQLHSEGVTIVMITHEPEIARHAQRIVTIRDGRLEQGGFGECRTEQEGDAS